MKAVFGSQGSDVIIREYAHTQNADVAVQAFAADMNTDRTVRLSSDAPTRSASLRT